MSEMVERVALATCSMTPCICKNKAGFQGMPCLDRARRGIEAMREPTDEQLMAIDQILSKYGYWIGYGIRGEYYRAMIDATIK